MLRTYNAVLTGNHLELTEDTREESDRPREVYVTFWEQKPESNQKLRGEKMGKALEKLAEIKPYIPHFNLSHEKMYKISR